MSVFVFDEEVEPHTPTLPHLPALPSLSEDEDDLPVLQYTGELDVPHLPARRRSSVYSRVSVRNSVPSSHGIAIPLDFGAPRKALAEFEPLRVLGQGAYGKVHLVRDRSDGKLYAQKQIRKPQVDVFEEKQTHASHVQRTIAERHILTKITHHANIVKLFYALQDADRFYLLLEYIPGGELFHHLASSSLGNVFLEEHVAFYAAQMALGLRHLHSLGIVYRDLKPENCLLNAAGHLVLTDFGLSKAIGDDLPLSACRSIIGTPEYMAPEIIKAESYGYPVDWWLLGCVVFDMMTGNPPFTGKLHQIILDRIVRSKVRFPIYLSRDARDLLGKLLQKNPAKRLPVDDEWDKFKDHRFFRKVDWASVENQLAAPPVVPVITDPSLAENFSLDFTSMKISDYDLAPGQVSGSPFAGFSYTASRSYLERYRP